MAGTRGGVGRRLGRGAAMKAVVVFESHWGNTAAVAREIATGIGPDAVVLPTGRATHEALDGADLVVVGAPVVGFRLATDAMRRNLGQTERNAPRPPDVSQPSMRDWLESLPTGGRGFAAFETGVWWSPGGARGAISAKMTAAGYREIAQPVRFVVRGKYGPLRDGELERARAWGEELGRAWR